MKHLLPPKASFRSNNWFLLFLLSLHQKDKPTRPVLWLKYVTHICSFLTRTKAKIKTKKESANSDLYAIPGEKKKHIVKKPHNKPIRSCCPTLDFIAMKDLDGFVVSWV